MKAAVVASFADPPHFGDFPDPVPTGPHQELVDVLAVGLHPRVRSGAGGTHYTGAGALPLVPGVDGVGRRRDGSRVYFVADDDLVGPMAERTVIDTRRSLMLGQGADPTLVAAAMNPAMSSWVALRRRVPLEPGRGVLVLGATGNAGMMAVQVARLLGAGSVVGAGRDPARLGALGDLGADRTVQLGIPESDAALASAAAEADVVLDYLWGEPAVATMLAVLAGRADRSRALDWIQIGSVAGPTAAIPSAALRSANLRIQGVGQGSVAGRDYLAELPPLIEEISAGTLALATRAVALRDIEAVWREPDIPGERIVVVP